MPAAAAVLITAAVIIWGAGPAWAFCLAVSARMDARAEKRRRVEQGREVSPEWLAILAATEPTPIYDALMCESMERAEGWVS